ncbi:MAG: hypothetical protein JSW58_13740 [Candidatus Latescibacterota bacterium]|nr:MAG: hypothetical protein JSW58_13740 [Candidatus Latescibacterota bacterium]
MTVNHRRKNTSILGPRLVVSLVITLLALIAGQPRGVVGAGEAVLIEYLRVVPRYFSPNGDATRDSVTFSYALAESATVSVFVVEKDSTTILKTLIDGVAQEPITEYSVSWDGRDSGGSLAAEDTFLVLVTAQSSTSFDTEFSNVFVDVTTPQVMITDVFPPDVFAPESPDTTQPSKLDITYQLTDPPPSDSVRVILIINDPGGDRVQDFPERFLPANGGLKETWDGASAVEDGLHRISVTVTDRAGNSSAAFYPIDIDLDGPEIAVTNLENGAVLQVLPDSLYGWTWHRHGVYDSVWVRYATPVIQNPPFEQILTTYFRSDTLFFSAALADSILEEEIKYTVGLKTRDRLGLYRTLSLDVTWDQTSPPPPLLTHPPPVVHSPDFLLDGVIDPSIGFEDIMIIYHNDAAPDTIFPKGPGQWPHALTLDPGLNRIWAEIVDEAGNTSGPSNTIEVTLDTSMGLFILQPFRPNDSFQINLAEPTIAVTLRIYDMSGNLVEMLYNQDSSTNISILWDGLNGDNEQVKKGPLVAVAHVKYTGGGDLVFREIFLFEP